MTKLAIISASMEGPQSITPEGVKLKAQYLERSQRITEVTSDVSRDLALALASEIKGHLSAVESSRKQVKEPFLRVGQQIDAVAKEHVKELEPVLRALNALIGGYEAKRMEALRKEEARKRREAEEAERERLRIEAEQKKLAEEAAVTPEERQRNLERELELEDLREKAEAKKAVADTQARQVAVQTVATKAQGGSLRKDWKIEVHDIHALYAARPACVQMTPKLMEIKILLDAGVNVPGVTATQVDVFATRGARQ